MQVLEEHIDREILPAGYRVDRFGVDKLNDLTYLYMAIYGKLLHRDYFLKKYNTAFTVVNYIGYLAYDSTDLPVAFYGVIPCFIEYQGSLVLAAQSADTMTHPAHRGKGLFVSLAEITYKLCQKEGVRLIFGFPNQNSLPGFINKLGWQPADRLERFAIPVKSIRLEKIAVKSSFLKRLYTAYSKFVLKPMMQTGVSNSVLSAGYGGVYRDQEFLAYKTYTDTYSISLGKASVWFKIQDGLVVGDITGFTDGFDEVMIGLMKLARKLGLHQLQFQVSAKSNMHALLKKYAEPAPSFIIAIKDLGSGIPANRLAFTFADIDIF